jgi:ferredoxin, 2Fe-2S
MPSLIVVDRAGNERAVPAAPGRTIMEILRDAGFDELLALCGGCCSCATCHVHIAPAFFARTGRMNEDEDDLLDGATSRDTTSRLSCQIPFTQELDGLKVTIAADD